MADECKVGDLCNAYYEDLLGHSYEDKVLEAWDRCPDPDCNFKISAHCKKYAG